jgi:hypothetical protein
MLAGMAPFPRVGGRGSAGLPPPVRRNRIAARKRTNENGCKTKKDAVLKKLAEAKAIFEKCQQHRS